MSTISVPISQELEDFIDEMIRDNKADNKAELVRRALNKYREDQLLLEILQARDEAKNGQVLDGDLREIAKQMK